MNRTRNPHYMSPSTRSRVSRVHRRPVAVAIARQHRRTETALQTATRWLIFSSLLLTLIALAFITFFSF